MSRPILSLLAVAALVGAGLAAPTAASADTTGTIEVIDSLVHFGSTGQSGSADLAYQCSDPDAVDQQFELQTELFQPAYVRGRPGVAYPEKQLFVTCDGSPHTVTVTYTRKYVSDDAPSVQNGKAQLGLYVGSGSPGDLGPILADVTVTGVAPDKRAKVKITLNAHPEPTRKGSRTTVEGKITRAGHAYAKKKVTLLFVPDDETLDVRTTNVRATKKGVLKTKVKATTSGTFYFDSTETTKTKPGQSIGDHVRVVSR